jgi:tetratricopeptide (TPR) repeat protein
MQVMTKRGLLYIVLLFFIFNSCQSSTSLSRKQIDQILQKGNELTLAKEYKQAIEYYEQYSDEIKVLYNLALLYSLEQNYSEASRKLLNLNERTYFSDYDYLTSGSKIAELDEDFRLASFYYKKILEIRPKEESYRLKLIDSLIKASLFEESYEVALETFDLNLYSKQLFDKLAELEVALNIGTGESWSLLSENHY